MEIFYVSDTRMWDRIFINAESIQMALVQRCLLYSEWIYHDSLDQFFSDRSKIKLKLPIKPLLHLTSKGISSVTYWRWTSSNIWIRVGLKMKQEPSILHWYLSCNLRYTKVLLWIIYQMEIAPHTIIMWRGVRNCCWESVAIFIGTLQFIYIHAVRKLILTLPVIKIQ